MLRKRVEEMFGLVSKYLFFIMRGTTTDSDSANPICLDLFLLFRRKIATYTSLQRPQSAIQILDDSSSAASVSMPSSISLSSSVRQPSSLSSSSVTIPSSSRRTIQAHNAALLRRLDKNKKAEIPIRCGSFFLCGLSW